MKKILIVDDDNDVRFLYHQILKSEFYMIEEAVDGDEAIQKALLMEPDLIIMDYMLPNMNGLEASDKIKNLMHPSFVYIIMVTAKIGKGTEIKSLISVDDYIEKPIDVDIFNARINVGLRLVETLKTKEKLINDKEILHQQMLDMFNEVDSLYKEKDSLLEEMRNTVVNLSTALSEAIEGRDYITAEHINRVKNCSLAIADELGLDDSFKEDVKYAAIFHDLGKVGIPDRILMKPEQLTCEEYDIIKNHTDIGYDILKHIKFFKNILPAIKHHHERWDGKGYPSGLKGMEIPYIARIIAVADAFDVITHDRPYKRKQTKAAAIEEIKRNSGSQFDPKVVEALQKAFDLNLV